MINSIKQGKFAMLAFAQQKKAINWNQTMFLQPKLDGVRCIFTKQGAYSRSGKKFKNVQHLRRELKPFFAAHPTVVLDGELYNHDFKDNFNKIISIVRTQHATKDQTLIQFHCYDYVQKDWSSFDWRNSRISQAIKAYGLKYTKPVTTIKVSNMGLAVINNNKNLKAGYEGSILRTNLPYENKRSNNLLKFKAFEDTEATITGYVEGKGKRSGTIGKFLAVDSNGVTFGMPVMAKYDIMRDMLANADSYIGKVATFTFFQRTPAGSYRHPLFKAIRNYE
jgi:DNA ligase-1